MQKKQDVRFCPYCPSGSEIIPAEDYLEHVQTKHPSNSGHIRRLTTREHCPNCQFSFPDAPSFTGHLIKGVCPETYRSPAAPAQTTGNGEPRKSAARKRDASPAPTPSAKSPIQRIAGETRASTIKLLLQERKYTDKQIIDKVVATFGSIHEPAVKIMRWTLNKTRTDKILEIK